MVAAQQAYMQLTRNLHLLTACVREAPAVPYSEIPEMRTCCLALAR